MLRTVVCDDEELSLELMCELLGETGQVDVIAACRSVERAIAEINATGPDLIIFDIEMPGLSGVEAASQITVHPRPLLAFATAHPEYALEAFEIDAIDYILKPFDAPRVARFVEKAFRMKSLIRRADDDGEGTAPVGADTPEMLKVRESGRVTLIPYADVIWIEAAGDYSLIHTPRQEVAIRMPIKRLEADLPPEKFVRVHRSAIVGIAHVQQVQLLAKGDGVLDLSSGTQVKSSRNYRGALEAAISRL